MKKLLVLLLTVVSIGTFTLAAPTEVAKLSGEVALLDIFNSIDLTQEQAKTIYDALNEKITERDAHEAELVGLLEDYKAALLDGTEEEIAAAKTALYEFRVQSRETFENKAGLMNVLKDTLTVNQVEKINKYFTDKIVERYGPTGTAIQQKVNGKINAVAPQMNNKKLVGNVIQFGTGNLFGKFGSFNENGTESLGILMNTLAEYAGIE